MAIQSLLHFLLIQLQRQYQDSHEATAPSADAVWIDQFLTLIDEHYVTKRNVRDYADLLGITAGHLTTESREVTGLPAGALIRNRIILEAKRLLVHTDCTVTQVGHDPT